MLSVPALSRFALWPWASYIIFLNLGFLMPALLVVVKIGDDLCEGTGPEKMGHLVTIIVGSKTPSPSFLESRLFPSVFVLSLSVSVCKYIPTKR